LYKKFGAIALALLGPIAGNLAGWLADRQVGRQNNVKIIMVFDKGTVLLYVAFSMCFS